MSEARTDRLEEDVRDIRATLARLEPLIIRIDERLTTELPRLATKAELEKKPGRGELWGAIAAMVGAQAVIAAVLAVILTWAPPARGAEPFDWDRHHARQDACRDADRIARECTRCRLLDELALAVQLATTRDSGIRSRCFALVLPRNSDFITRC